MLRLLACALMIGFAASQLTNSVHAEDPAISPTTVKLAGGQLILQTPKEWKKLEKPKSRITAHEFIAPADAKDDDKKASITFTVASGSVDANIARWYGQFSQPDGKSTKDKSKLEEFKAGGQTVHLVEIPGNFSQRMGGGPFAGGKVVVRKDYRMLAAIVVTEGGGKCFIKATGPDAVCKKLTEGFKKMLKDLEFKK